MNNKIKVILPAGEIPEFSTVTKINGEKPYTLQYSVKIHKIDDANPVVIESDSNCVFLIAQKDAYAINTHAKNKELVWHTDTDALSNFLAEQIPY